MCYDPISNALYIADTNNHRLCRVSLSDPQQPEVLELETPDTVDSFNPDAEDLVKVRPGDVVVELKLPEGLALNSEAPSSWKLKKKSQEIRGKVTQTKIDLRIEDEEGLARLELRLFLCDAKSATCSVRSKSVPLMIARNGASSNLTVCL